jgi:TRAP-type uncharacterized transport system fused permease subunit
MDVELGKKLEKLKDVEVGHKRKLGGRMALVIAVIGFLMSTFHIYVLLIRAIDPWIFRSIHIVFGGALLFALAPGWKSAPRDRVHPIDYIFIAGLCISVGYILWDLEDVILRMGVVPTRWDIFFSIIFVGVVLEMTRRTTGWVLVITALVTVLYACLGQYLPGFLTHRVTAFPVSYLFSLTAS